MPHNVSQLGEVAEIEAQMFGLALHFNRCTDVNIPPKPPFCQTAVVRMWRLINDEL